ncbi:MAG TPA: hypothetical protein VFU68_05600 [Terracidiphilus sp.]|nr:hypothetical protein [Terracidiphilus sp.]
MPEAQASSGAARPGDHPSPLLWLFNRVFSRHAQSLALLLVLPMLLAPSMNPALNMMGDPDIWWHLADARYFFTHHHVIFTDPYAFTVTGVPWINWEWLSEIPYWFSYQSLHLQGIYLVAWLVLALNLVLFYFRGYWLSRHAGAAFWAACVGFTLTLANSGPRTIAIAYLALSVEMAILEAFQRGHRRLLWLLPPLFVLWINLHGIWFIGFATLVLYVACGFLRLNFGIFEHAPMTAADRRQFFAVMGVSLVALFLNPYGWRLLWNPIDMMLKQHLSISVISEWRALSLSSPEGYVVTAAILLLLAANCIRPRKWTLFEFLIVVIAFYSAIDHVRFSFLAAVLITPMLARDFQRAFTTDSGEKTIPAMNLLMCVAAAALIVHFFPSESTLQTRLDEYFPLKTIASIQPDWRTFDIDFVGGRMDFDSKPIFIDSRFDIFDHQGVLHDYLAIENIGDSPLEMLDKYRVDHALLKKGMGLAYVLEHAPGWQLVSSETCGNGVYLLFARTSAPAIAPPAFTPAASSTK